MLLTNKNKLLRALTLTGCFATGIIYTAIGIIALLSFFKLKNGGADENSFFVLLNSFTAGRIVNGIIILGALCFIIWRFYEAFKDPYHTGNDTKAILLRTGAAFSSGADAFIALAALQALFNRHKAPVDGEPVLQRNMAADLLQSEWGHIVIIAAGSIIIITAAVLLLYGLSSHFTEAIQIRDFSKTEKYLLHAIAYAGYFSRGVILAIIGFFLLKAAVKNNGGYVVNTDKAFDFIGDHIGHVWFIVIAAGTIAYGVYMFILGCHYKIYAGHSRKRHS